MDILQFRQWRRADAEDTVGVTTWDRDAAAIVSLYKHLVRIGYVRASPWRSSQGESLGSGFSTDVRVRHLELEQYLFFRDVGFGRKPVVTAWAGESPWTYASRIRDTRNTS